jgi:hypothetical protein
MSAFYEIPRQVLFGRLSHLKAENKCLTEAMAEYLAATDARMRLGSSDDRREANLRVRRAYDACCVLVHGGPKPPRQVRSTLRRLDHVMKGSDQLTLL